MHKIIVTKHRNLVAYLIANGLATKDTPVKTHVEEQDIVGLHVIGVLPLKLACKAERITEVPLRIPYDKKGQQITLEEITFYAGTPKTYKIEEVKQDE